MDIVSKLANETREELDTRRRNAAAALEKYEPGSPRAIQAEQLLAHIDEERRRRSLPGNITAFLERFPRGFGDPDYLREERNDKMLASRACQEAFVQDAFARLDDADLGPLIKRVKDLVNATNLIQGSFEKPKLLDAIANPEHSRRFLGELGTLLHGPGEAAERLESFSDYMHSLNLRKWTYGTYFLFLHDPASNLFVKPESIKKAADIAEQDIAYDPAPTAHGYRRMLRFARWIAVHLNREGRPELVPVDMIDVQSFIWKMAPTGKFARD